MKSAVKFCRRYGLIFDAVNDNLPENVAYFGNNCRKVYAHYYIDDKNLRFPGSMRDEQECYVEMIECAYRMSGDSGKEENGR